MRQWLSALQWGAARRAWELMVGANPLPACMGRICYAPCESGCVLATRRMDGGAVGIKGLEAAVGELALHDGWALGEPGAPTGKRVAVVGSGPCGLSAAHQLVLVGHEVVLLEAHHALGGMLRRGISERRLPPVDPRRRDLAPGRRADGGGAVLPGAQDRARDGGARRRDLGSGGLEVHGGRRGDDDLAPADPYGSLRSAHGHCVDRPWRPGGEGPERLSDRGIPRR